MSESEYSTPADSTPSTSPADTVVVIRPEPAPKPASTSQPRYHRRGSIIDERASVCSQPTHHPHHTHLRRRVDLRLVPILSLLYLLCFLCRQNIGNAKTFHLMEDLKMSDGDYTLALTVFFFTYSTFDIPSNMLLKLLRPNVWLPLVTLASGVVTVGMGMSRSGDGLIVARLFLGVTECGLFPGVAYVITLWYRRKEAQFRQALFFCAASMAGAFAGLLAVGLAKMDGLGGLEGWRWIMIVEGLITVVAAVAAFWLVLDIPARTTFLSAEEKELLLHRLSVDEFGEEEALLTAEEQQRIHGKIPKTWLFKQVFTDYHLALHILVFLGITCPLYSISLCLPTIVMEMGYTKTQANFLTVPIYLSACVLSLVTAFVSDRLGVRAPFLAGSFVVMFVGFLVAAAAPGAAYAGVFIASCGLYPAFPGALTWCANNLASAKKRSIAMAVYIGCGSLGGAMGANFYRKQDQPAFLLGHLLNLGFVSLGMLAGTILYWRYRVDNRQREAETAGLKKQLERDAQDAQKEGGDAEEGRRRHEFLVAKEEQLAKYGDRSVWFKYVL